MGTRCPRYGQWLPSTGAVDAHLVGYGCPCNGHKQTNRRAAQEALDQINNKYYADAFALRGKTVEKIGMNFMIDEDKTIVLDWWKFGE